MSIQPGQCGRGAASFFPQPLSRGDMDGAQCLEESVYYYNCRCPPESIPPLADIEYRSSDGARDILHHVFRWDLAPYDHVFQNGFRPRRQGGINDATYFNLELYVNHGGRPLDTRRETTHAFVSTTISSRWYPSLNAANPERLVYRYEIYAPGGILVPDTLGNRYRYPAQEEVCFVAGIAPQYIRSAQLFQLTFSSRYGRTTRSRVNTILFINRNFNPQSHPEMRLRIKRPVIDYYDGNTRKKLEVKMYPSDETKAKLPAKQSPPYLVQYYTYGVTEEHNYLDSAFRSSTYGEAFLFIQEDYVVVNYDPGSTNDYVVDGPGFIPYKFQCLHDTAFAEHGIDCAFGYTGVSEAFLFYGKQCVKIDYGKGKILEGPKTIAQMFPFLKYTPLMFDKGLDAAFEVTGKFAAYFFKRDYCALVQYGPDRKLLSMRPIIDEFPCLEGTPFESDIGAAFASHIPYEYYIFKGQHYALLKYYPDTGTHKLPNGVEEIRRNWESLRNILPANNRGVDIHEEPQPLPDRDQDDL